MINLGDSALQSYEVGRVWQIIPPDFGVRTSVFYCSEALGEEQVRSKKIFFPDTGRLPQQVDAAQPNQIPLLAKYE